MDTPLHFLDCFWRASLKASFPLQAPKTTHKPSFSSEACCCFGKKEGRNCQILKTLINLRWISVYWEFKRVCGIECLHVSITLWSFISLFFLTDILSINKITQRTVLSFFFFFLCRRVIAVFPWACFKIMAVF